ncbi:hypothetical protein ACOSP7_004450 [Xanthoceras sorbifolium]
MTLKLSKIKYISEIKLFNKFIKSLAYLIFPSFNPPHIQAIKAQQSVLISIYANNNLLMTYHLNQDENNQASRGGSILGHRTIYHGRVDAERNLWDDYFVDNLLYNDSMFHRRF